MKCEILYGPEAGTTKHFPNNDPSAHTMIRAGMLRLVETEPGDMVRMGNGAIIPKMQPPAAPRFYVAIVSAYVAKHKFAEEELVRIPALVYEAGTTLREEFCGDPKDAPKAFGKRAVPDDVLRLYKEKYEQVYPKEGFLAIWRTLGTRKKQA
jgi:hypothetical protein